MAEIRFTDSSIPEKEDSSLIVEQLHTLVDKKFPIRIETTDGAVSEIIYADSWNEGNTTPGSDGTYTQNYISKSLTAQDKIDIENWIAANHPKLSKA